MARYPHLPIRRLEGELARRSKTYVPPSPPWTPKAHSKKLLEDVATVIIRAAEPQPHGERSLVMRVATVGLLEEHALAQAGLTLLDQTPESALIVYSDDRSLAALRGRTEAYGGTIPEGQKTAPFSGFFDAIESFAPVDPVERIGPVLRTEGIDSPGKFLPDQIYRLDVELWWHTEESKEIFFSRLEKVLHRGDATLLSRYFGSGMLIARVLARGSVVREILVMNEVAQVELPPTSDLAPSEIVAPHLPDLPPIVAAPVGPPMIGIVDSGINSGHPLLAANVAASFGVPTKLGDDDEFGHGTGVAGLAVYGDLAARISSGELAAHFRIASAKVVNHKGQFDDDQTVPAVMDEAIRRLSAEGCRVINISLCDRNQQVGARASQWAATLDTLARELDLVIVVSAGNISSSIGPVIEHNGVGAYPDYLLRAENRILEPSSSANCISVGSMAHSNGLEDDDADYVDIIPIAGIGHPSPFTRAGPGHRDSIKPDFIEYGGTAVWNGATGRLEDATYRNAAGILTLDPMYVGRPLSFRSGTSFAAPVVAYKAGLLREFLPSASANLIRALMSMGADHPGSLTELLQNSERGASRRIGGYGHSDVERSLESEDNRVVLTGEDKLGVDRFAVYEVPIPEEFQANSGRRHVRVSLAFDPPVRHTRKAYIGLKMGFHLIRGASEGSVFDQFRKWEKSEGEPFKLRGALKCPMEPKATVREKGTLQTATFTANSNISRYGDRYYLAVRCEGGWARDIVNEQRFAVAVELWHEADLPLYQTLSLPLTA